MQNNDAATLTPPERRAAMPITAAVFSEFNEAFGVHSVKATEGGFEYYWKVKEDALEIARRNCRG